MTIIPEPSGIRKLSKATGIPVSTLYCWRKNPKSIPIGKFAVLAKAMNLSDQEILKIIRKECT